MTINDKIIFKRNLKVNQRKEFLFKFTIYTLNMKLLTYFINNVKMILFGLEYLDEVNFDPKRYQKVILRTG